MCSDAELTESYRIWYIRHVLLASVGADFVYRDDYTEAGTDRCFYALLKAEDLQRRPVRRLFYKLFHRRPGQTTFDTSDLREWEKAVRAALDRMSRFKQ